MSTFTDTNVITFEKVSLDCLQLRGINRLANFEQNFLKLRQQNSLITCLKGSPLTVVSLPFVSLKKNEPVIPQSQK